MDEVRPTRAYDLLEPSERLAVDEYVNYAVNEQKRLKERIGLALYKPIPSEYIKKSKYALYKPVLRAAIAEKIKEKADEQDISPDRVIQELAVIAFSKPSDYMYNIGLGELTLKNFDEIPSIKMGAVKSIESTPTQFGTKWKLVLQDKITALKSLAEYMGLVAPDKPPVLREYVAPIENKEIVTIEASKAYEKELERLNKGSAKD